MVLHQRVSRWRCAGRTPDLTRADVSNASAATSLIELLVAPDHLFDVVFFLAGLDVFQLDDRQVAIQGSS